MSSKSVNSFLASCVLILSLSAPGAAKFENPLALSYNESSSFAVTNCSSMLRPTLYEGSKSYGFKIILSEGTSTKLPLIK